MKTKMLGLGLIIFGLVMTVNSTVNAASSPKIGYFDLTAVLNQSHVGKQAKEDFDREKDKMKADMDAKASAFKTAREEFDKKKAVMDENTKNKKSKEIMEMQQEGEKMIMESNAKLNKLSSELMAPIVDKIVEIARKIGKEDKYDFILELGKGGLVYANESADLTKRVLAELDKNPPILKK